MASWFYLELYTDTTQYVTEYLKSRILTETKRKCDMSKRLAELKDIYIDEATSHCICVTKTRGNNRLSVNRVSDTDI